MQHPEDPKDHHNIAFEFRAKVSRGILAAIITALVLAAGGTVAFLDKIVKALLTAASVVLLTVHTFSAPQKVDGLTYCNCHPVWATSRIFMDYDRTREVFQL